MRNGGTPTIYVGGLPSDIRLTEVENLFCKYGPIVDIYLKAPPGSPAYAFIEFEDVYFANVAIHYCDRFEFYGSRLRVELARGRSGSNQGRFYVGSSRRSDYRVLVTGLPHSASWQGLKDHMRYAGDVCFSEVFHDIGGMIGVVHYTNFMDMRTAIRSLDHSEFRDSFSRGYIRVREYYSESPSYNSRHVNYSRSRSRSPYMPRFRYPSRRPCEPRIRYRRGWSRTPSLSDFGQSRSPPPRRLVSRSRTPSPVRDPLAASPVRVMSPVLSDGGSPLSDSPSSSSSSAQSPEVIEDDISPANSSD